MTLRVRQMPGCRENATCYLPRGDAIMRTSRESRTPDAYGGASTVRAAWHFVP
ncbi:hypothetical protein [Brasilonema octagenarum]|uniref:hypothetical protein n=1 Tax=Brasilonema octagenarum TaxID=417105 RepID=UPI00145DD318|nr:hypothetical protein [Brasilonema octagenarum]